MAGVSPISTLARQYRDCDPHSGASTADERLRLLIAVHCNAACCVSVQDAWKLQGSSGGNGDSHGAGGAPSIYGAPHPSPHEAASVLPIFVDATPTTTSTTAAGDPYADSTAFPPEAPQHAESTVPSSSPVAPDDPFSFLNAASGQPPPLPPPTLPDTTAGGGNARRRRPAAHLGRFFQNVAATSTKALERGRHHLAVQADQGRTPDCLVVGLFDGHSYDRLVAATNAERTTAAAGGVRFRIPLVLPASCDDAASVVLKLWVRSGAALAASKHYYLAETAPISVGPLRAAVRQQQQQQQQQRINAPAALFVPLALVPRTGAAVGSGGGGCLFCTVTPASKFPAPASGRGGWSLSDPDPATAYSSAAVDGMAAMFHLPLDQSYAFAMPHWPAAAAATSTLLLATERTAESAVILPVAAAFARLAATAGRASLRHCRAVRDAVDDERPDAPTGPAYADVTVRVSHLQSNTASASYLHSSSKTATAVAAATVVALFQRPDSIFEVEVIPTAKLPLHPTAAEGLRQPDNLSCRFYPKPVLRQSILPAVLQASAASGLLQPATAFLLGSVRLQIRVPPRRIADGVAPENPFDPVLTAAAAAGDESWECLLSLDGDSGGSRAGETRALAVYNRAGQNMGSLLVSCTIRMPQTPAVEPPTPSAGSPAATGLVALTGLPQLTDGVLPTLDFDDTAVLGGGANPEQQRRRSQFATMGHFVAPAYLDQHINSVRALDCEILEERAVQYMAALDAAYAPRGPPVPSHRDRSPRPFRPSSSRTTALLSGIGFNVHTASLSLEVLEPPEGPPVPPAGAVFTNITCGAPADHARGFGNAFAAPEKKGSAAAATIGFKSPVGPAAGGLRRLEATRRALAEAVSNQQTYMVMMIANYFVEQRQQHTVAGAGGARPVTHVPAGNVALQALRGKVFEAVQCLHHLTWTCAMRRASVFSQALGIAVSSYLSSVSEPMKLQSNWPEFWARHGFLVSYEGLLSAAGKELGMIEDASVGIDMLRMVRIILVPDDGAASNASGRTPVPHSLYIRWIHLWNTAKQATNGQEMEYILQIGIDPTYFEQRIPPALKNGAPVQLYPILFEVGVDIFQAASNLGSTMSRHVSTTSACEPDVQKDVVLDDDDDDVVGFADVDFIVQLNFEAFQKMNAYAQSVSPAAPVQATATHQTHPLLATLFQHIVSSSGKMNHDILAEAAALAQKLSGGTVVFCKSGKDRTAMHVTYKQAQFATRFRQLSPGPNASVADGPGSVVADSTLKDAMLIRLYGTRLPICEKNVGQAKYAFNSLQVKFMPDALKPPASALAGFLKGGKVFGGGSGGIES